MDAFERYGQAFFPIAGNVYSIAFLLQTFRDEAGHLLFVFDDENTHQRYPHQRLPDRL
jgi:hypothetical protein